jgi:hypothetical protein
MARFLRERHSKLKSELKIVIFPPEDFFPFVVIKTLDLDADPH